MHFPLFLAVGQICCLSQQSRNPMLIPCCALHFSHPVSALLKFLLCVQKSPPALRIFSPKLQEIEKLRRNLYSAPSHTHPLPSLRSRSPLCLSCRARPAHTAHTSANARNAEDRLRGRQRARKDGRLHEAREGRGGNLRKGLPSQGPQERKGRRPQKNAAGDGGGSN